MKAATDRNKQNKYVPDSKDGPSEPKPPKPSSGNPFIDEWGFEV